ncbi:cell cycle inhibitor Nif1 protein [Rutstroemia sp. NJR-2017a BBW]|nr:cell cycle inhibitor Nif1 protein [Rutstroemia sp. NJR-2017a BBW]
MPLLDLLKKKDKVAGHDLQSPRADPEAGPVFTFMRSDTHTQEVISPPTFSTSEADPPSAKRSSHENRATRLFKGRPRSNSGESGVSGASGASSSHSHSSNTSTPKPPHGTRKISERFGLRKYEAGSSHVPSDLPEITVEAAAEDKARAEVQWEKRATILAQQNERSISRPGSSYGSSNNGASGGARNGVVASRNTDEDLQEGIRLHESGQFEEATKIFARLADPHGDNHALSQILYNIQLHINQATLKAGKSQPSGSPDIIIRRRSLFASSDLLFTISCSSCLPCLQGLALRYVKMAPYAAYITPSGRENEDSRSRVNWPILIIL